MKPVLTTYDLGPHVVAFSTTRHGGCSTGNYGELNINAYCGDAPEAVGRNRELLRQALGLASAASLVLPHQTHGTTVRRIDDAFLALGPEDRQRQLEGVDALTTNVAGICIGVSTADCIPIILYDARQRAAAAVHAGWRGTLARIAERAVEAMRLSYGSRPDELRAVIGPGISLRHFEVGDEVYQLFCDAGFPMALIGSRQGSSRPHIDLKACNRLQLEASGLRSDHIADCGICTFANAADYFSARRLGIDSGRIFSGIIITP